MKTVISIIYSIFLITSTSAHASQTSMNSKKIMDIAKEMDVRTKEHATKEKEATREMARLQEVLTRKHQELKKLHSQHSSGPHNRKLQHVHAEMIANLAKQIRLEKNFLDSAEQFLTARIADIRQLITLDVENNGSLQTRQKASNRKNLTADRGLSILDADRTLTRWAKTNPALASKRKSITNIAKQLHRAHLNARKNVSRLRTGKVVSLRSRHTQRLNTWLNETMNISVAVKLAQQQNLNSAKALRSSTILGRLKMTDSIIQNALPAYPSLNYTPGRTPFGSKQKFGNTIDDINAILMDDIEQHQLSEQSNISSETESIQELTFQKN